MRLSGNRRAPWPPALLLAWLWLGLAAGARAQAVPPAPVPARLVVDLAHVLQANDVQLLEQKLRACAASGRAQVAIVTVPTLGGASIESYARALFNTWGLGDRATHNGLLVLVAPPERRMRIQLGYGLEAAISDAQAQQIVDHTLAPAFRQQQYCEGLDEATTQLIGLLKAP